MARDVLYGLTFVGKDQLSPTLSKVSSEAKKADQALDGLEKQSTKLRISASGLATGFAAVGAAAAVTVASVIKLGQGMLSLAESAAKVQAIEIRTLAAIRERTSFTDEEFAALKQLNGERERTLGIDADAQLQLQGTLASMGVHKTALDQATKATIGLSTATGQGLNEAAKVVAKSLAGNTGALQEYGIKVASVQEAQAKFDQMFAVAAAQADTYATSVSALGHTWEGLGEAFGAQLITNQQIRSTIAEITAEIQTLTDEISKPETGSRLAGFFGDAASAARELARLLPVLIDGVTAITTRLANWLRVRREVGLSGMIFMDDKEVEQFGAELRARDEAIAAERQADRLRLEGYLAPAAGGMGGLESRIAPFKSTFRIAGAQAAKSAGRDQAATTAQPKDTAPGGETWDQFTARMRKANALEREAAQTRGDLLARLEQENQQRIADIQESFYVAQQEREQAAREAAAKAAEDRAAEIKGFFTNIGNSMVSLFSEAFSSIGRLQNETTTEIVRNEEGMLEERTRITKQYVQTAGGALKQFLGDSASMFIKAALHQVAVLAVVAAAEALKSAFGTLGLLALLAGPAIAGGAYAMVKAGSSRIPPPPKFHVGGRVPGLMGQERLAVLQGGERVTSVADTVDNRGGGGGITINNNLLVAPSRVQVERVNRDVLLPSARRLQRLGFAG